MSAVLNRPTSGATVFSTMDHDALGVGRARHAVVDWLRARGINADLVERVELLSSELVTNALRYTEGRVEVRLDDLDGDVLLEVLDESEDLPSVVDAGPDDTRGRGLALVAALADDWGASRREDSSGRGRPAGKVVWTRISRDRRSA